MGGWIDIFLNTLQCFSLFIDSSDEFGFFVERIFRSMGKSVGQVVLLIAQFNWSRYKAGVVFPHQFPTKCISVTAVRIIGHIAFAKNIRHQREMIEKKTFYAI